MRCGSCGLLTAADAGSDCPVDGTPLERLEDVSEAAVERALLQDAEVAVVRDRPEFASLGGIAAVLRF